MNKLQLGLYHKKCEFTWLIKRIDNRRTLTLHDRSCGWNSGKIMVLSKEKLKNLFDKNRINNLLYLEGLEILKNLWVKKQKENNENR
jgi:hypothetical protein